MQLANQSDLSPTAYINTCARYAHSETSLDIFSKLWLNKGSNLHLEKY